MRKLIANAKIVLMIFIATLALSGCVKSKPDMYYWGSYEAMLQRMYTTADDEDPATLISQLESDIEKAEFKGKKVPPGIHAHIAFLHAAAGNTDLSIKEFEQEKILFPESAQFIDGMMSRAFKGNKS